MAGVGFPRSQMQEAGAFLRTAPCSLAVSHRDRSDVRSPYVISARIQTRVRKQIRSIQTG